MGGGTDLEFFFFVKDLDRRKRFGMRCVSFELHRDAYPGRLLFAHGAFVLACSAFLRALASGIGWVGFGFLSSSRAIL